MKKLFSILGLVLSMAIAHAQTVPSFPDDPYLGDTSLFYVYEAGGTHDYHATGLEYKNYVLANSVLTTGSYSNPAWLTALAYSKLTGVPTFGTLATIAVTGTASAGTVPQSNGDGTYSWAMPGGGSVTVVNNAIGNITISSGHLDLSHPVNTALGFSRLDGAGQLLAGELGNYTTTFQAYNANTTTLGNSTTGTGSIVLSSALPQPWELKSANFTAVAGHKYQIDSSAGSVTMTLPASATAMDSIEIQDAKLSWNSNGVTVGRNSLLINGGASDYSATVQGNKLSIVYISSGYGWSIK